MNRKSLIQLKDEQKILGLRTKAIRARLSKLEESPEVKKYIELSNDLLFLINQRRENAIQIKQELQNSCNDQLWYLLLSENAVGHDYKNLWTCKCVICGKEKQGSPREFSNVIVGEYIFDHLESSNYSYNEVKREYVRLRKVYHNMDTIISILIGVFKYDNHFSKRKTFKNNNNIIPS